MSDLEDQVGGSDGGGDDLFGDDGSDASLIADNPPLPSDDELASEPDRQRSQRSETREAAGGDGEGERREKTVSEEVIFRHGLPKTKDGNMQAAKVPNFLRFLPTEYKSDEFHPSEWAIENSLRKIPTNLIRYRRNPKTGELESNANIYRWSDGSLTMQVGEEHFDIQIKDQVPPANKPYIPDRDAHRYIAAAHMGHGHLLTVAHINEEWTIRPDKQRVDEDTELLRERMGLAKGGMKEGEMIITTTEDPELQKKQAEQAEKERTRAQRRRRNAEERIDGGGGGGGGFRRGGLSIGDLEGGRRPTGGRKRGPGGSSKRSGGGRRRNDEYDSDDDLPAGAHGNANEYDREDDFIASSDDGMESGEDGGEEDDDILDAVDRADRDKPRAKRPRTAEPSDADEDADGEPEDLGPAGTAGGEHARRRMRRIVDDDDSE
ncbi:hypothetical protein Daus18300_001909 [Diaporthe australafricana]|uniref:RNA polymerase-associated protein LEO1 n=1 Tax=Diaporthe australafricana TaxID=127596 RepID=A0ABR3XRN6_9PEZI